MTTWQKVYLLSELVLKAWGMIQILAAGNDVSDEDVQKMFDSGREKISRWKSLAPESPPANSIAGGKDGTPLEHAGAQ